jgi:hypothetical protein
MPVFVNVPRWWLRLLHADAQLLGVPGPWTYGSPAFFFWPSKGGSLVLGEAAFPTSVTSPFCGGSKRAAICPVWRQQKRA